MYKLLIACVMIFAPAKEWQTYIDATGIFEMKYPDNWEKKEQKGILVFLSPKENDKDVFQENVNLITQDLSSEPMTLEAFTELSEKQIKEHIADTSTISLAHTKLSGLPADEMTYVADYQGYSLKLTQYWLIKDNVAYVFTYTAQTEKYDKFVEVATQVIKSFKFRTQLDVR